VGEARVMFRDSFFGFRVEAKQQLGAYMIYGLKAIVIRVCGGDEGPGLEDFIWKHL